MPEPKITEEQANEALKAIQADTLDEEEGQVRVAVSATEEVKPAAEPSAETKSEAETAEATTEESQTTETDDLVSLKKRIEERDKELAEHQKLSKSREQAIQKRYAENEQILRDRFIRKSALTDKALKTIEAIRNDPGVPEAEVDRTIQELRSSMNPASASYVAPVTMEPPEDHRLVVNNFLNEKMLTEEEAGAFAGWLKGDGANELSPVEQAVAQRDLDGFLRIAHRTWRDGESEREKVKKTNDAVEAVRVVQRTQKEAARAASAIPTAPRKQPVGPKTTIDTKKLTQGDISALMRQSVEQYD